MLIIAWESIWVQFLVIAICKLSLLIFRIRYFVLALPPLKPQLLPCQLQSIVIVTNVSQTVILLVSV